MLLTTKSTIYEILFWRGILGDAIRHLLVTDADFDLNRFPYFINYLVDRFGATPQLFCVNTTDNRSIYYCGSNHSPEFKPSPQLEYVLNKVKHAFFEILEEDARHEDITHILDFLNDKQHNAITAQEVIGALQYEIGTKKISSIIEDRYFSCISQMFIDLGREAELPEDWKQRLYSMPAARFYAIMSMLHRIPPSQVRDLEEDKLPTYDMKVFKSLLSKQDAKPNLTIRRLETMRSRADACESISSDMEMCKLHFKFLANLLDDASDEIFASHESMVIRSKQFSAKLENQDECIVVFGLAHLVDAANILLNHVTKGDKVTRIVQTDQFEFKKQNTGIAKEKLKSSIKAWILVLLVLSFLPQLVKSEVNLPWKRLLIAIFALCGVDTFVERICNHNEYRRFEPFLDAFFQSKEGLGNRSSGQNPLFTPSWAQTRLGRLQTNAPTNSAQTVETSLVLKILQPEGKGLRIS